jgi:hypothetical protein
MAILRCNHDLPKPEARDAKARFVTLPGGVAASSAWPVDGRVQQPPNAGEIAIVALINAATNDAHGA